MLRLYIITLIEHTIVHYTEYTIILFRSVIIHNRSNVVVHYEWKAFATEEDEQTEKEMYHIIVH